MPPQHQHLVPPLLSYRRHHRLAKAKHSARARKTSPIGSSLRSYERLPPERKAKKRARDEDHAAAPGDFPFEEAAAAAGAGALGDVVGEASRRPPAGVFQLPWQKCRGGLGLGVSSASATAGSSLSSSWELRDVFFRSLVDGGAAAIGVPGDRLVSPPPSRRALLDGVDVWLAAAANGEEVDPVWRSALGAHGHGPRVGEGEDGDGHGRTWARPAHASRVG